MTTAIDTTAITYNRETKDFDITDAGEHIGSAPSYHAAEQKRTAYLASRTHARPAEVVEVVEVKAAPVVVPNPGFHLSSYTVYDRAGQSTGSYAVHLCDDCATERRANGTMASKWSGECINGYCDDCQGGPSVSHFRLAEAPDAIHARQAEAPTFAYAELDNQPASDAFPDEPLGDCALCGKPAWRLDETLSSPLCPDHKALETTWIANRAATGDEPIPTGQEPGGSGGGGGEVLAMAGTVWAPGPPPPPEPPAPAEPAPTPAPASALVALLRMALEEWHELGIATPYDVALAQLARLLNPPSGFFLICGVCGGPHLATQCPQVIEEKARQMRQIRFGLSIHASYVERRATLAAILRDSDDEKRTEMAEALTLYLAHATRVALPVAMVRSHFEQLAA